MSEYEVFLRDRGRNLRAQVDGYERLKVTMRHNEMGSWEMVYPVQAGGEDLEEWLVLGCGIVLKRNGATGVAEVLFSGPITRREVDRDESGKTIIVSGKDDLFWISKRVALPVPGGPPYTSASHDVRTDAASTVILEYASYNGEAGGHSWRRVPGLVLGTDSGIGETITGKARFGELLTFIQALALKGDVSFRLLQDADNTDLILEVYEAVDRSDSVRFSDELFNVASSHLVEEMPGGNYGYIAGQGTGTAREIYEGGDSASIVAYGRLEFFKDQRNEDDASELPAWLNSELEKRAAIKSFSCKVLDTDYPKFGVDYEIGDLVSVVTEEGEFVGVVQEVGLDLSEAGEVIEPVIGTAGDRLKIFSRMDDIENRLDGLEVV